MQEVTEIRTKINRSTLTHFSKNFIKLIFDTKMAIFDTEMAIFDTKMAIFDTKMDIRAFGNVFFVKNIDQKQSLFYVKKF